MLGLKVCFLGTPLAVQWFRLHTTTTEGLGSFPGQATETPMLQAMAKRYEEFKKKKKHLFTTHMLKPNLQWDGIWRWGVQAVI